MRIPPRILRLLVLYPDNWFQFPRNKVKLQWSRSTDQGAPHRVLRQEQNLRVDEGEREGRRFGLWPEAFPVSCVPGTVDEAAQ